MGHEPIRVDRIAGEPSTDLVEDAAGEHAVQCMTRHAALAARQQELDRRRRGELRRASEAAVHGIGVRDEEPFGLLQKRGAERAVHRLDLPRRREPLADASGLLCDLRSLSLP